MRSFITLLAALALVACGDDSNDDGDAAAGTGAGDDAGGTGGGGSGGAGGSTGGSGGSGGSAGNDAGGTGGTGGDDAGGMGGDGGGNDDDTPIAQRDSDGTFTCSVSESLRKYEQTVWSYTGTDLVELTGGDAWLVRVEANAPDPFNPAPYALIASEVDAAGELTDGTTIAVGNIDNVVGTAALALSDGSLGIFWIEDGELRFAALEDTGAVSIEPKTVATGDGLAEANSLNLALAESGAIAAVWNTSSNATFVAVTDESGATATPVAFEHPTLVTPRIAAGAGGTFVALWRNFDPDFMDPINVFFSRLDATGHEVGEPAPITDFTEHTFGAPFGGLEVALQPVGEDYLVAWPEGQDGDFETNSGAYSVVRVQRVSATGEPQGVSVLVDAQADDIDQVEPSFVPWGDALALLWGRGTHIYICGGCVPDHSVNMVLIDPETLSPRSNVVQITPEAGGLLNRTHALAGDELLLALQIQFHVHFEPGFAAIHCE